MLKVTEYNKILNYNSGSTKHYENLRILRELELTRLLGKGQLVKRFLVGDKENAQIHEVWSNGIVKVYSYKNHKKITVFAPNTSRLSSLFEGCGIDMPEELYTQSQLNTINGYNELFSQ